ncbi:MAG: chromosomal replication initiator protein DnaA, partial [Oscillospiraceae bacterium]|nr:chromosomal replication initiator protein DnaA [Candidatus Equicaccousia limihippi]
TMQIESISDVWNIVCAQLKEDGPVGYDIWIKDLVPLENRSGEFVVSIQNGLEFKKNTVEMNYKEKIEGMLTEIMGVPTTFKIVFADQNGKPIEPQTDIKTNEDAYEKEFTFDNYVVGSCNRYAHAVAMAVAENPINNNYNPFLIYGNSGVGKTHLMLAIKNRINELYPNLKTKYIRCEEFTNLLISKMHTQDTEDFRNKFRTVDVLFMDDIQFISGKESTQEEFFNTFEALYRAKKQIVVTSDKPPKDMRRLEDRIRSRLEGGCLADINPPDFETRVGIIKSKAAMLDITLEDDIVYYIAENIEMNTRQLEGVVKKLKIYISLQNKIPNIAIAQKFIKEIANDKNIEPIKVDQIISAVSAEYGISESDIISKRKTAPVVFARQVAMYITKELTELSYDKIGKFFDRDHTTVLYNVEKIEHYLKEHRFDKDIVDEIIKTLKNQ